MSLIGQSPPAEQAAGAPAPEGGGLLPGQEQAKPTMPGGEEISEEQVGQFLELAYRVIYGGDTPEGQLNSGVSEMLRSGAQGGQAADPVGALATTAATVAAKVMTASQDEGSRMDGAAAFAGMMELVGELATDAEDEGIYDYSQEEVDAAGVRAGESLYNQAKQTGAFPVDEMQRDVAEMQRGDYEADLAGMGAA